jgi:hypothetical protein
VQPYQQMCEFLDSDNWLIETFPPAMGAQGAHTKHAFESMAFARSYYSYPTLCFRLPRFVSPNHSVVSNQARGTPDLLDLMSTLKLGLSTLCRRHPGQSSAHFPDVNSRVTFKFAMRSPPGRCILPPVTFSWVPLCVALVQSQLRESLFLSKRFWFRPPQRSLSLAYTARAGAILDNIPLAFQSSTIP